MAHDPGDKYRYQLYWQQVIIPRLIARCHPDVYLSPFHLTPVCTGVPIVTTVHDVCFLNYPMFSLASIVHRSELFSALIRAQRLMCVSHLTLKELSKHSAAAANRAVVVQNGAEHDFLSLDEAVARIRKIGLSPNDYFLWIGLPSRYKNIELLFEAFATYSRDNPEKKLVIVTPNRVHQLLAEHARQHNVTSYVRLLSPLDAGVLNSLYRCAVALVFPSSCEGFGFPILEAAAQGCPSVAYSQTPASEILGGAIPLADELSVSSFVSLMCGYVAMTPADRTIQTDNLRQRASMFSSDRMARQTLSVLADTATG